MIFVKSFLISVLIVEGIVCSFSDIRANKISNKNIVIGMSAAVLCNIVYFILAGTENLLSFLINVAAAVVVSFLMYALHIWAGGDVKLFVLFSLLIPADLLKQKTPISTVTIFITAFSLAFIYLLLESLFMLIKKEKIPFKSTFKFSAKSFLNCMFFITATQFLLRTILANYYYEYLAAFLLLNVILVLVFNNLKFLQNNISFCICAIISLTGFVFSIINKQYSFDIKSIIITVSVILFRGLAEKFNYKEIKTTDIKRGMILSYGTVLCFVNSRVKGLPSFTTEDMSSRITQEEADAICRWAVSKNGKETIVILRKIPFAIFITLGFVIYLILGVFVW